MRLTAKEQAELLRLNRKWSNMRASTSEILRCRELRGKRDAHNTARSSMCGRMGTGRGGEHEQRQPTLAGWEPQQARPATGRCALPETESSMTTFDCPDCGRTFKYGNRVSQQSRANWRRYVLERHRSFVTARPCPELPCCPRCDRAKNHDLPDSGCGRGCCEDCCDHEEDA